MTNRFATWTLLHALFLTLVCVSCGQPTYPTQNLTIKLNTAHLANERTFERSRVNYTPAERAAYLRDGTRPGRLDRREPREPTLITPSSFCYALLVEWDDGTVNPNRCFSAANVDLAFPRGGAGFNRLSLAPTTTLPQVRANIPINIKVIGMIPKKATTTCFAFNKIPFDVARHFYDARLVGRLDNQKFTVANEERTLNISLANAPLVEDCTGPLFGPPAYDSVPATLATINELEPAQFHDQNNTLGVAQSLVLRFTSPLNPAIFVAGNYATSGSCNGPVQLVRFDDITGVESCLPITLTLVDRQILIINPTAGHWNASSFKLWLGSGRIFSDLNLSFAGYYKDPGFTVTADASGSLGSFSITAITQIDTNTMSFIGTCSDQTSVQLTLPDTSMAPITVTCNGGFWSTTLTFTDALTSGFRDYSVTYAVIDDNNNSVIYSEQATITREYQLAAPTTLGLSSSFLTQTSYGEDGNSSLPILISGGDVGAGKMVHLFANNTCTGTQYGAAPLSSCSGTTCTAVVPKSAGALRWGLNRIYANLSITVDGVTTLSPCTPVYASYYYGRWKFLSGTHEANDIGSSGYGTVGTSSVLFPSARSQMASTYEEKNAGGDLVWIYGGQGRSVAGTVGSGGTAGTIKLGDIWSYNVTTNLWTPHFLPASGIAPFYGTGGTAATTPGARFGGALVLQGASTAFSLWGGSDAFSYRRNDLWQITPDMSAPLFTGGSNSINHLGNYGTTLPRYPAGKELMAVAQRVVATNGNYFYDRTLWSYGGYGSGASGSAGFFNDVWTLNSTPTWTPLLGHNLTANASYTLPSTWSPLATLPVGQMGTPAPRQGACIASGLNNVFWMFGGYGRAVVGGTAGTLSDLWEFNLSATDTKWRLIHKGSSAGVDQPAASGITRRSPSPLSYPAARTECLLSYDPVNQTLWLFGGHRGIGSLYDYNDLWSFDLLSGRWTHLEGSLVPITVTTPESSMEPGPKSGAIGWTTIDITAATSGSLTLFGGHTVFGDLTFNSLWRFGPP